MRKILKKIVPVLCLIPFATGTMGYMISGERVTNAMYASFALYFTNPISEAYNGYIEFARWTAPLITATAILCALRNVWDNIKWWLNLFCREDTVAVYSDEEINITFDKGTQVIYPGENFKSYSKSHIIIFSSDEKSLDFFEKNKEKLKKSYVYIGLRELETGLIKETDKTIFFDINGSIARKLWKEIQLWNGKKEKHVVIYGNSPLAQNILSYGLILNLFSKNQRIVYHVMAKEPVFLIKHPDFFMHNEDEIVFHDYTNPDIWNVIRKADVVIVADKVSIELIQMMAVGSAMGELYLYFPNVGAASDYIEFGNIKTFGRDEEILTDENIRKRKLIKNAIDLNSGYADEYGGEKNWDKLSGFLKNSNISSADYYEILAILPLSIPDEELAELEHIRWCRFHYLNYWKYGIPANGKSKDTQQRIHKDLRPYDQLDEEEKVKDLKVVKMVREGVSYGGTIFYHKAMEAAENSECTGESIC